MSDSRFVGAWRLVAYDWTDASGVTTQPYSDRPVGFIIYSADGYMSVDFMRPDRPRLEGGPTGDGTPEQKVAAMDGHISYAGPFDVQGDTVVHHVQVSSIPNWVGRDQVRRFEFSGNRLTLRAESSSRTRARFTVRLVWERVGK